MVCSNGLLYFGSIFRVTVGLRIFFCNLIHQGKDLDYEEMEVEHRQLLSKIRKIRTENRQEPDDKVALKAHVSTNNR